MKKALLTLMFAFVVALIAAMPVAADSPGNGHGACWGQATAVFAQMGEMGAHSSELETPRLGLRNLARVLAEAGVIPDDSMQSLAACRSEFSLVAHSILSTMRINYRFSLRIVE